MEQLLELPSVGFDPFGRFMKIDDVMTSVGISRPQIYKLMRREDNPFPSPVKVGSMSLWVERDIVDWKRACIEEMQDNDVILPEYEGFAQDGVLEKQSESSYFTTD